MRVDVELGSKPVEAGVRSALRFCVMLSSIEERDIRRKSRGERKLDMSGDGKDIVAS